MVMRTAILTICFFFLLGFVEAQVDQFKYINSPADELNPVLSPDGQRIYFIRVFDSQNAGGVTDPGDIWISTMTDSLMWSPPERLQDPINNPQFNGVVGIESQGNGAVLYEHYMSGGKAAKTQGMSLSRISANNQWSPPQRLDMRYFYNKSDHVSASLSRDGSIMVLALESYGSLGAEDLYVSFRNGNEWSEPRNLGRAINTQFQEMTPYIAPDNKTLFFASNGYGGYGGRDIFVSSRLDDTWRNWSEPRNLGPDVNTEGVELYFQYFPGEEKAIFTSTQNSDGYSDLRMIDLPKDQIEDLIQDTISIPEPVVAIVENDLPIQEEIYETPELKISGAVKDSYSGDNLKAVLLFKGRDWQDSFESSLTSGFEVVLPTHDVYEITVEATGYVSVQEIMDIRTTESAVINHDFVLQPIAVGTTVKLNNVLFVRGTTQLLESSYGELDLVVKMLNENSEMKIFLAGHTDNQGNARLNQILSQDRVGAVINYLVANGIDKSRLAGKGYGGTKPVASNDTEETRRLNRRVEFTIEKY